MSDLSAFGRLFGVSSVSGDARKAALLLRTVCDADRQWLLERLSPSEQGVMTDLLSELEDLGLPTDRSLLHEVIRDELESRTPPNSPAGKLPSAEASLETASAIQVAKALADEPAALVARLLARRDWSWSTALLSELNRDRRRDVESSLVEIRCAKPEGANQGSTPDEAIRLDERLLASLSARLGAMASEPAGPDLIDVRPPAGVWHPAAGGTRSAPWWRRLGARSGLTFGEEAHR